MAAEKQPLAPASTASLSAPGPRRKMPWAALLVLAALGFTAVTTELLPAGLLPQISHDLGVEESAVGSLTAAYAVVIVVTAVPLSKFLAGRVPRKRLLVSVVVLFALSNVLLALSPQLAFAVGARLLGGVAHGLLWSSMAPYVARIVPPAAMGRGMAVVFSGNSIAMAVGAPLGTLLGGMMSWRASFLVLAGVAAVLGVLAMRLLPAVPLTAAAARPSIRQAVRQPGVVAVATAWPLLLFAHFALFTYIALFVRAEGIPEAGTGISLSMVGAAGLLGIWAAGLTADRFPRRSLLATIAVIVIAYCLMPLLATTWPGLLGLTAAWGAGVGALGIYNQAAILRAGRDHGEAANGLTVVTIQLGIALGAWYGAGALGIIGPQLLPLAAAIPAAAALAITFAGRRHAYPPGPSERQQRYL
jgi:predicted MFS family arabinose efflux permease